MHTCKISIVVSGYTAPPFCYFTSVYIIDKTSWEFVRGNDKINISQFWQLRHTKQWNDDVVLGKKMCLWKVFCSLIALDKRRSEASFLHRKLTSMGLLALDTKRTFVELFDDDEGFDVKSLGEMSMLLLKVRLTRILLLHWQLQIPLQIYHQT